MAFWSSLGFLSSPPSMPSEQASAATRLQACARGYLARRACKLLLLRKAAKLREEVEKLRKEAEKLREAMFNLTPT